MINPKSVRYISPQIVRCGQCQQSRAFVIEMLQRWLLGSYPHRHNVVEPNIRQKILKLDFDGLTDLIRQQPSKHLYCIVAECIAAVSVSDPQIHIVAAAGNNYFAAYVEAVCNNASVIAETVLNQLRGIKVRRKRIQLKPVSFGRLNTHPSISAPIANVAVQYITTSASVRAKQLLLAKKIYNTDNIHAFVCNTCNIVHGALTPLTRGSRLKAGVSVNLSDPDDITCNLCLKQVVKKSFVGCIAITNTAGSVSVCCMCANVCGFITSVGSNVYCRACSKVAVAMHAQARCACGMPSTSYSTPKDLFAARSGNEYVVYTACATHAAMIPTLQSACTRTPTVDECNLFFSTFSRTC